MNDETLNRAIELKKQIEEYNKNLSTLEDWNMHSPAELYIKAGCRGREIAINDLDIKYKLLSFLKNKYEEKLNKNQSLFDSL